MQPESLGLKGGVRAALPLFPPTLAIGVTFGVLAEPVMGGVAAVVMSIIVFAGSAQFAALGVLVSGGGAGAAIAAGLLMNARFLPMGLAVAPALRGGPLARAVQGQAVVDMSWAMANRGDGTFDRDLLIGATVPQAAGWMGGTALGVLGGAVISNPETYGLDAVFPAAYLALLAVEVRRGRAWVAAGLGAAIALALLPFAPPGLPIIAASFAALTGLKRP